MGNWSGPCVQFGHIKRPAPQNITPRGVFAVVRNRVREKRKALNWSQGQLSIKSGISVPTISEVENGRHIPSVEVALRLAEALYSTVDELFSLEK